MNYHSVNLEIERIGAMEFSSGDLGIELPVDGGSGSVTLRDQGLDFPPQGCLVRESLLQAGAGQDTELDLRPRPPPGQAIFSQLPCLGM